MAVARASGTYAAHTPHVRRMYAAHTLPLLHIFAVVLGFFNAEEHACVVRRTYAARTPRVCCTYAARMRLALFFQGRGAYM